MSPPFLYPASTSGLRRMQCFQTKGKNGEPALDKLPTDILIAILHLLDPMDIISMRMTCRAFGIGSYTKAVWLGALERVCEAHGILERSFPAQDMSTEELEHAATAPTRFLSLFSDHKPTRTSTRNPNCDLRPTLVQTVPLDAPRSGGVYLVPGGRYLLVNEGRLALWDVGYRVGVRVKRLARLEARWPVTLRAVGPCASGSGEIALAVVSGSSVSWMGRPNIPMDADQMAIFSLYMYHIDPSQGTEARFAVKGELRLGLSTYDRLCSVDISQDTLIMVKDSHFVAWNWVENKGCKWETIVPLGGDGKVFVSGRIILGYRGHSAMAAWPFPTPTQFSPLPGNQVLSIADFPVIFNKCKPIHLQNSLSAAPGIQWFPCQFTMPEANRTWRKYDASEAPSAQTLCLMPILPPPLRLYSLDPRLQLDGAPCWVAQLDAASPDIYGENDMGGFLKPVSPLYRCHNGFVMCSATTESGLVATLLPAGGQPARARAFLSRSRSLTPPHSIEARDFENGHQMDFCPFSGRLVYVTKEGEVRVVDYLPLPGL
ncbi:hypothetical protein DFP72DRAFT_849464 [Ephemerocybe angulata]|uniref:F-box domain-containing protein n=1 Tax=Ephemerocybe angulata TaxID=980116 RepID=A0A8H6M3E1_9AGAR|nr:hypothetical protein DFP72DRAFT_849464 [Tulosesus angulatus]